MGSREQLDFEFLLAELVTVNELAERLESEPDTVKTRFVREAVAEVRGRILRALAGTGQSGDN